MGQSNRLAPVFVLVALFLVLQVALIAADNQQSPLRAARQFTQAYFNLDPEMQEYLSTELAQSDAVDHFLYKKQREAELRGLPLNYLRHGFTQLHLQQVSMEGKTARIHVSGTTRVNINPAFLLVGKLFFIGDNYPVEAVLELVREEEGWKVAGEPFELGQAAEQPEA